MSNGQADPAWIPLAAAGAALVGGLLGAMLQGTFSVRGWRRQTRLEAYAKFLDAEHEFHNSVILAFPAYGHADFDDKWIKVLDAQLLVGRAASLVSIAGPASIVEAMRTVTKRTHSITADYDRPDLMAQAGAGIMTDGGYAKFDEWINAADEFEALARRVLRTENVNGRWRGRFQLRRRRRNPDLAQPVLESPVKGQPYG